MSDSNEPPMRFDPGLKHRAFLHPAGVVLRPRTTPERTSLTGAAPRQRLAFGPGDTTVRSRTQSNATKESANVRHRLWRSLTELYSNVGEQSISFSEDDTNTPRVPRSYDEYVQIADVYDGQRLVGGDFVRFVANHETGGLTKKILRKPVPLRRLPDVQLADCTDQINGIWSLYALSAGPAWARWIRSAFQDGVLLLDLGMEAGTTVTALAAKYEQYRELYRSVRQTEVRDWLTDSTKADAWDYRSDTINDNPLMNLCCVEVVNTLFQKRRGVNERMSISSRMFSTQYSLVALEPGQNREDFVLYAAGSFPPLVRSDQARDLLAYICNMSPENLTSNPQFLKPSLLFFTGEALDHLLTDCIETIGEDVLAQALDKAEGNKRPVGSAWFPLHLLSFCASYLLVEITRVYDLKYMFGKDIMPVTALQSFSTYHIDIHRACVQSLESLRRTDPEAIADLLSRLDNAWDFRRVVNMMAQDRAALQQQVAGSGGVMYPGY